MFLPREENQDLVEYAIIIMLVAIVVIVALAARFRQPTGGFSTLLAPLAGA